MDKVIIDGVDVSECKYFDKNAHFNCMLDTVSGDNNCYICKDNQNCYYKQLQRLKHQYADVLKLAKENADSNEYCLQELEQENERLKEENEKLNKMTGIFSARLCEKYRTTLQEIRDIAEEISREKVHNPDIDTILTKINEVIGA